MDHELNVSDGEHKKGKTQLLDATLRDGSYAVNFQLNPSFVEDLVNEIDGCGLDFIEIGHGVGVEAERAGYTACNIDLPEWCRISNEQLTRTPWGVFAQPSFTRLSTLNWMCREGMDFVRIGMEAHKIEANLAYLEAALSQCSTVFLTLMKTSITPKSQLAEFVRNVPKEIAGIYVVDSCGTMLPSDVRDYIDILASDFGVVGFHGHDNIGLANANSLEAIAAGAQIVDGTLHGIGRGSGNAATEIIAGILTKMELGEHDFCTLSKLADFCHSSMDIVQNERLMQVMGGVIGVHSSLFPMIDQICSEYMLDALELMKRASEMAMYELKENDLRSAALDMMHAKDYMKASINKPTMVNK